MSKKAWALVAAAMCMFLLPIEGWSSGGAKLRRGPRQSVWVKKAGKPTGLLRVYAGRSARLGKLTEPHRTKYDQRVFWSAPINAVRIIPEGSSLVSIPEGGRLAIQLRPGEKVVYNRGASLVGMTMPIKMDRVSDPNGPVVGRSVFAILKVNDRLPLITVKDKKGKARRFRPDIDDPLTRLDHY